MADRPSLGTITCLTKTRLLRELTELEVLWANLPFGAKKRPVRN